MIKLSDIKKYYGSRLVLDIPELRLDPGGQYAVIGANGSGKTTLMRLIAGTLAPCAGSVDIPAEMRRDRGYMPQHPYIFGFSVQRNVRMSIGRHGSADSAVADVLNAVGMASFARAKAKSLSGGEAQRVALARVIAVPRKLLILDEPTSSTDIAGNDLVESAIRDYAHKTGCTLIISTHSPAQAVRLSDKVLMLHEGRLVENGSTAEIIARPCSREGVDFLQHFKI